MTTWKNAVRWAALGCVVIALASVFSVTARAETLSLSCKNLNRDNTTTVSVDVTAGTVTWGGTFRARITAATIDWDDDVPLTSIGGHHTENHIDRLSGAFTEAIHDLRGGGTYVEQWQCQKLDHGAF